MEMLANITKGLKINSRACITGLLFAFFALPVMAGTITDTKHDFSASGWSGGEICIACHTPHNANTAVTDAPLWNHNLSAVASYALYQSDTLNAAPGQPTGTSKLCLSCHDGTVAYDNTTGGTKNLRRGDRIRQGGKGGKEGNGAIAHHPEHRGPAGTVV